MDQACLNAIAAKPPPTNVQCPSICTDTDFINGTHCSTLGVPTATPIITKDPNFGPNGGYCYCCCSCFAMDTPIGVSLSDYSFIQDLNQGDLVIATGAKLDWKETTVKYRSGGLTRSIIDGLYLVTYQLETENEPRQLLVGPDHLFLTYTQRKLKAVQYLIPGDGICGIDDKKAEVLFVATGSNNTSIHTIELEGEFNGKDLDGHLLNSNGVVTADFVVQSHYETTRLHGDNLYKFSQNEDTAEVGTKKYASRFRSKALSDFLDDPNQWPKGFAPTRNRLINVPSHAHQYFTPAQADDIKENGVFTPKNITVPQTTVLKLIKSIQIHYPETNFLIDWNNSIPNAYSWEGDGQTFVVVNGGLIRLEGLYMEFFSLLIVSAQARLNPETSCVGEADYDAMAYQMRKIWLDSLYVKVITDAIDQMNLVFNLISEKNKQRDNNEPCLNPGISCRQEAITSGLSFMGVPTCAKPKKESFELVRAQFGVEGKTIVVTFNESVEKNGAENTKNYELQPPLKVTKATLKKDDDSFVILDVNDIDTSLKYLLTASHLVSGDDTPISPKGDSAIVGKY